MRLSIGIRGILLALVAIGALAWATPSLAIPIFGANVIVANTGNVTLTYLGHSSSSIPDSLYLETPSNGLGMLFNSQTTLVGTTFNLGTFTQGTELVFRLYAEDTTTTTTTTPGPGGTMTTTTTTTPTPRNYYTGPASRNPDGIAHAIVDDQYALNTTYVGFEDIFGGGDLDYDDLKFSFTNTRSETLPEPATLLLFGTGLGTLALTRRLRRTKTA